VISLVMVGVLFSLAVAVPMILVTYPGDECLLFVSVRGEALIYGHPAGCTFISASHSIVAVSSIVFFIILLTCQRRGGQAEPSKSGSIKSLRGSVAGASAVSFGPRAKPTVSLIIFSLIILMFVLINAIVILSGYLVTCGELQYETRRKLYGSLTLGTPANSVYITCFSLYRDTDFHARFHFDHYELSGSWHGQYTAYRHGRPHVWSGTHKHLLDIPTGLELSLASCWISSLVWVIITLLLILHRRNVKSRNREQIAESIEDARIWASDMASGNGVPLQRPQSVHQYEMIKKNVTPYESLSVRGIAVGQQQQDYPPPPSDSSDVDTLLAHQNVIANTHADGSYFMTPEGTYVQLVNGVLTNVDFMPSPPASVQYSQLQFSEQSIAPHSLGSYPPNYHQAQSLPNPSNGAGQPHPQPLSYNQINSHQTPQLNAQQMGQTHLNPQQMGYNPMNPQHMVQNQTSQTQMAQNPVNHNQFSSQLMGQDKSLAGSVTSSQLSQAPTVSHLSQASAQSSPSEDNADSKGPENTRMNMRIQRDMATLAGMKCSQF